MAALLLSATLAMSASAAAPVTLQSGFVLLEPETPPLEATMDTPSCRAGTDCGGTALDTPPLTIESKLQESVRLVGHIMT